MAWTDGPLVLYHGTDNRAAVSVQNGVQLQFCQPFTDFGRGFYTTTSLRQAKNWANARCRRINLGQGPSARAAVVEFRVNRPDLDSRSMLVFILEGANTDYWDFVTHCRLGRGSHRPRTGSDYDVVFGPVSLWEQRLVIANCDQVSFHTQASINLLQFDGLQIPGSLFDV